ncbi:MAG: hypothetical protein J7K40_12140 [candidate division Zixibacteria bacterium]|nr:hypothetical protein [candidate division Zixibacteria bacterium]
MKITSAPVIEVRTCYYRYMYTDVTWEWDGENRLTQTIANCRSPIPPSLLNGDDVKIDGIEHHVVSLRMMFFQEKNEFVIEYTLKKGLCIVNEWLQIGDYQQVTSSPL